MEFLFYVIGMIVGCLIGWIIFVAQSRIGTLKIDHSNPEKDIYRLCVDDLDKLPKKRIVVLKVDNNADLSQ
ncbi:MAG: hypothetical protein J6Q84_07260 [Kiritimatiellae bacterium]|nr:hypothetical protein [Kiritimatiellia bacterium]